MKYLSGDIVRMAEGIGLRSRCFMRIHFDKSGTMHGIVITRTDAVLPEAEPVAPWVEKLNFKPEDKGLRFWTVDPEYLEPWIIRDGKFIRVK